jgi:beta-mannosidase
VSSYRALHEGWTLRQVGEPEPVPATVPGCVHTDLLAAGRIPDPYLDRNEQAVAWIGRADWLYEATFDWEPGGAQRTELVCAGLDTVATITLNDVEIGHTANMHRSYRFDVGGHLRQGSNTLAVRFDSAYRYAEDLKATLGDRPNSYPEPFNFIRKMACNFGWDWGPTLVTAGIWQPIGLHEWSTARLAEVRPQATMDGALTVHIGFDWAETEPVTVAVSVAGQRMATAVRAGEQPEALRLTVPDVEPWWPRGYGGQRRYELVVTLTDANGTELDHWRREIGFRSVRLDTAPDPDGTPFHLLVNEKPVSVRGFNWIPDDCFPHRVDRQCYATRLGQAADAGANFIRVWGGGRYESEDFYDQSDALGLLVGQDFLFACAAYPEEEPLAGEVAAEAREQVTRLARHPSLVLWTGNNENLWGHADWGWAAELDGRTWGAGYYFELLPAIVAELDPTRPYWPGSPYSGRPDRHPNDPAHGTTHIWDVWNTHDYRHYASYRPRFVAEFGFQGPATYATLRRASSDEPLTVDSPHQKASGGNDKLFRWLSEHLPDPKDFDDWHWATQLNQARAIRFGVEHLRSLHPLCTGVIVWQLNDCWPVTSWSAVDGDGRRKPLWYALRKAFADRLLTIQPGAAGLDLVAVNDTDAGWAGRISLARLGFAGDPRAEATLDLAVPVRGAQRIPLPDTVARPEDSAAELITFTDGTARGEHFFAEDFELDLPEPRYTVGVRSTEVIVTAEVLLRDLALFPDRLSPWSSVDSMLVTLLPGESATFQVRGLNSQDDHFGSPVLRCANDLGWATWI